MTAKTRKARVVLVTGSSSGIGRACCERLVASGRIVYGGSRSQPTETAGWTQLTLDVTDEVSVAAAMAQILAKEGRLDAVVHSAGVSLVGPLEDTTIEEARRHLDVNYFGAYRVLRAAIPIMRAQGEGKLLVIGSIAGLIGLPFASQYSASKFALDGLIEAIRPELRPFGIHVTAVHPGDFNTSLSANRQSTAATQPGTPYHDAFARMSAFYSKAEAEARGPEPLAARIDGLLERRRLPVRVIVGTPIEALGVVGKKALPSRLFEYVLGKIYGG